MNEQKKYRVLRRLAYLSQYILSPAYAPTKEQLVKARLEYQALKKQLVNDLLTKKRKMT